jgi:uracil-DNA glycosylase
MVEEELPDCDRPDIMILAEAPGDEEVVKGRPLVGPSGRLLNMLLYRAGIRRTACLVDNVFHQQLSGNDLKPYTLNKAAFTKAEKPEVDKEVAEIGGCPTPSGGYLDPAHWPSLQRLKDTIERWRPKVVVALGSTALWAVTGQTSIGGARGAALWGKLADVKVLPTYHPAFVLRKFSQGVICVEDLRKAQREAQHPDRLDVRERHIWVEPTLEDLEVYAERYIEPLRGTDTPVGCDIETKKGQIECIGFSGARDNALVVPFIDWDKPDQGYSYWPDVDAEAQALLFCKRYLADPEIKVLGQNFMYDVQWLFGPYGIQVNNYSEDTRLMHHALYPELPKDQAFLVSVYEKEASWKHLGKEEKQDG